MKLVFNLPHAIPSDNVCLLIKYIFRMRGLCKRQDAEICARCSIFVRFLLTAFVCALVWVNRLFLVRYYDYELSLVVRLSLVSAVYDGEDGKSLRLAV